MTMTNDILIKHANSKTGYVDVMDAILYDIVTNAPIIVLDTLKMSNITGEGQKKQIKGGIKAPVLAEYAYGRTVELEFQDAVASLYSLKELWGGRLNETEIVGHFNCNTSTDATGKIVLTDTNLVAAVKSGVIKTAIAYDETGKSYAGTVTVGAQGGITFTGISKVTPLKVFGTATYTPGEGKFSPVELTITSNIFPRTVKMIGKTIGIDIKTGQEILVEIEIPKLAITPSNNMTLESEGDATVFDFTGSALLAENNALYILRHLDWSK